MSSVVLPYPPENTAMQIVIFSSINLKGEGLGAAAKIIFANSNILQLREVRNFILIMLHLLSVTTVQKHTHNTNVHTHIYIKIDSKSSCYLLHSSLKCISVHWSRSGYSFKWDI